MSGTSIQNLRRTLAGIAAGALGATLLPFIGAGTASALVSSVSQPQAVRAGVPTAAGAYAMGGTALGSSTADAYILSITSGEQFAGVTEAGGSARPNAAGTKVEAGAVTFANAAAGTTVSVGIYKATSSNSGNTTCAFTGLGVTGAAPTATATGPGSCSVSLEATFSQPVGGAINAIAITPTSATIVNDVTQKYVVTATDSTNRRTLPSPVDVLIASSSNPAVASVAESNPVVDSNGAMSVEVAGANAPATGTVSISIASSNLSVTAVSSTLNVIAAGTTKTDTAIGLAQTNVAETTSNPASIWNRTFDAAVSVTSLNFGISGLTPGATYRWEVLGAGNIAINGGTAGADAVGSVLADAEGKAVVSVAVTGQVAGDEIRFGIPDASGTPAQAAGSQKHATVTFANGVVAFQTPDNGVTIFAAPGASTPVTVLAADQYGNPSPAAAIQITATGSTTPAVQGTTDTAGSVTLSVPAPAAGATTYNITGQTAGGANILSPSGTAMSFTLNVATPTVAFTTGVNTTTSEVVRLVPTTDGRVSDGVEATEMTVSVTANGVPITGAAVSFTSTNSGVRFSTVDPASAPGGEVAWNSGATTENVTSSAGNATVWVWSTKSGINTVTATVGTVQATGDFVVRTPQGSGRNVAVTGSPTIIAGDSTVLTIQVTDNFGNPVPSANNDLGVRFKNDSPGSFGGQRQLLLSTDVSGSAQVVVTTTAQEFGTIEIEAGVAGLAQFGASANRLTALSNSNDAPGFTASNSPLLATMEIVAAPVEAGITITGKRGKVNGKPGVIVKGQTTGFTDGDVVIPRFKFAGQSKYSTGSARPVVEAGDFSWSRKTGKKTYVYFVSEDGSTKSNRIVIDARR